MSPSTLIRLLASATLFFSIIIIIVPPVHSVCCDRCSALLYCQHKGWCTGVGSCNLFCCDCDGGCWSDYGHAFGASYATSHNPKVRFAEFDTDADGFITAEEVFSRAGDKSRDDNAETREQFAGMDDDGDGRLSWREFEKHA